MPIDLALEITNETGQPVTPDQVAEIERAIGSIPQKPFTQYLKIGDEPSQFIMTVDIQQYVDPLTYNTIKESLKLMPRSRLKNFFETKILPMIDSQYRHVVWKAVINIFNEANLEVINRLGLTPWAWEDVKTQAVYMKEADSGLDQFMQDIGLQNSQYTEALDQRKREILEEEYSLLAPLADLGLEIGRQAAIKKMLDLKQFDEVSKIIQAYKNASDDEKAVMETGVGLELNPQYDASQVNMSEEIPNPALNNALQQQESIPYYEQVQPYIQVPVMHPLLSFFRK